MGGLHHQRDEAELLPTRRTILGGEAWLVGLAGALPCGPRATWMLRALLSPV
jgi:hypothetical protein